MLKLIGISQCGKTSEKVGAGMNLLGKMVTIKSYIRTLLGGGSKYKQQYRVFEGCFGTQSAHLGNKLGKRFSHHMF